MRLPLYQIDAFSAKVFAGNPAAVCPLDAWLPDDLMQAIAAENNLAETAFFVRGQNGYDLRWFTPTVEVDLCGHATLAAAYVIATHLERSATEIAFQTRSGTLCVTRTGDLYTLDFPARPTDRRQPPAELTAGLGCDTNEVYWSVEDYLVVLRSETQVRGVAPDFATLAKMKCRGIIVTAQGDSADFVSRFFAPGAGINEDPVTGSAHCTLTPFWAARLGRKQLRALQVSKRGGELFCVDEGERVKIAGYAAEYMVAEINCTHSA
jgi:PhzF family phenazine biosynthesis protein